MYRFTAVVLLVAATLLFASACSDTRRYVDQEELFFIRLGKLEHTIDLFQSESGSFSEQSDIYMDGGLIWVLNRNANKIMTFTSYGDLVSLLYDPDENPVPAALQSIGAGDGVSSRRAVPYQFNRMGWFTLDSQRRLLVEDTLPRDRWVESEDGNSIYNRVVLRFSSAGNPIDYIGQDGPRGAPFPPVQRLDASVNDELAVVSRVPGRWLVYWFLPSGEHLTTVEIPVERLPVPEEGLMPSLQQIIPDPERRRIYLKIDYYREETDRSTEGIQQVSQDRSSIYWIDLDSGLYKSSVDIPRNVQETDDSSLLEQQTRDFSYTLLGVVDEDHLLLMSEEPDERVQLMLLSTSGRVVRRRYITIPREGVLYRRLRLGDNGILIGLLAYNDGAEVHWWRTDGMLPQLQ